MSWRVYIGPLNSIAADINVLILSSTVIWGLVCLTEAVLIKAIMATNYKHISSINDKFFNDLFFMFNFGFSFGSHFALFFLGSLGSDQLLIGVVQDKSQSQGHSIFYVITFGTISVISSVSLLIISFKKFIAYRKDKNMVHNINIMLSTGNEGEKSNSIQFNTSKYNKPIISTIFLISNAVLVSCVIWIIIFFNVHNDQHLEYVTNFLFVWAASFLVKNIFPILMATFCMKEFRAFIVRTCQDQQI